MNIEKNVFVHTPQDAVAHLNNATLDGLIELYETKYYKIQHNIFPNLSAEGINEMFDILKKTRADWAEYLKKIHRMSPLVLMVAYVNGFVCIKTNWHEDCFWADLDNPSKGTWKDTPTGVGQFKFLSKSSLNGMCRSIKTNSKLIPVSAEQGNALKQIISDNSELKSFLN